MYEHPLPPEPEDFAWGGVPEEAAINEMPRRK